MNGYTSATLARLSEPHYVYRLHDADMRLLYVGCTYNPRKRLAEHRREHRWFVDVATTRITAYPDAVAALEAERAAHADETPTRSLNPHNSLAWTKRTLFIRADVDRLVERVKAMRPEAVA